MCRNLADRQQGKGVKGMAFNILDIMNAATKAEAGQNRDYQDIVVNYRDIVVTKHNLSLIHISEPTRPEP